MSIFQRTIMHQPRELTITDSLPGSRFRYPNGAFAALRTNPVDIADAAYDVFRANFVTPGIAERDVARVLLGSAPVCLPVELSPGYAYELGRERTDIGRMRVFALHLVRMQFSHESNQQQLRDLRGLHHFRKVRILPGCCEVCDKLARRSWRIANPPELPVRGCLRHGGCRCAYVPDPD